MVNLRRVVGRTLSNLLSRSEAFLGRSQCHRYKHTIMIDNLFLPPSSVKGMTVLDKELFKKNVTIPCIYLPLKSIENSEKFIKGYLLKLQNFRPVTVVSQDCAESLKKNGINVAEGKMALLDPRKVNSFGDLKENDRTSLEKLGITKTYMTSIDISLTFDNYKADEILRSVIPLEFDSVSGYSLIGHIVHLNLRDHLLDYKHIIGEVLLDKIKAARTVVNKVDIIDSTFRNFQMELLCGDNDMIAKVRENKCVFEFDFSQVYWNPRLSTEHERIVDSLKKGDVLYDVFCGVGPFAIPAAKKGCIVFANDLNPFSIQWLRNSMKLNKIRDNLQVFNKDGNEFIKNDVKNHMLTLNMENCSSINIVMNLPALAPTFLPTFLQLFTSNELAKLRHLPKPKIFVYCFVKGVCDATKASLKLIGDELGLVLAEEDEEVLDVFFVRDVAPNKKMMRVSLLLTDRIVLNRKRSIELDESVSKRACH